jgi:hypothetical protein
MSHFNGNLNDALILIERIIPELGQEKSSSLDDAKLLKESLLALVDEVDKLTINAKEHHLKESHAKLLQKE